MLESVNDNQDIVEEEAQGSGASMLDDPQQNIVALKTSSGAEGSNY